jgi:glycerol-1-phosphate dehydrogenase [NAD(P)+]
MLAQGHEHPPHGGAVGAAEPVMLRLYEHARDMLPFDPGLPSAVEMEALLQSCGCMAKPSDLGVDVLLLKRSILHAKEVRPRYTILSFAAENGFLEDFAEGYPYPSA